MGHSRKVFFLLFLGILLAVQGTFALMIKLSEQELWKRADLIVIGTVNKMESKWAESKYFNTNTIVTDVFISPQTYLKGFSEVQQLVIRTEGGTLDNIGLWVEDEPEFRIGEKVLVYLKKISNKNEIFDVVGLSQGKFTLSEKDEFLLQGYSHSGTKRKPASKSYYIHEGIPADWRTAIQNAHTVWNNDPSRFTFAYAGTTTRTAPNQDGYNVIYRANYGNTTWLARNQIWFTIPDSLILENDIYFNTYHPWSTTGSPNAFDVWSCALHEFGHSLCLLDINDPPQVMHYTLGLGQIKRQLNTGDQNGIRYIYDATPIAPTNLTATRVSATSIELRWNDNSRNEDGFKIERKIGSGGSWTQVAVVNPNTRTWRNTGLSVGHTYYYRVRAYNGTLHSSYSNEARASLPITIFFETFEGSWPGAWTVGDLNSFSGLDYWGRTSYRRINGTYSAWCAEVGHHSVLNQPNNSVRKYDNNMRAYLQRSVNLSGYSSVTLDYYYWLRSESNYDFLRVQYLSGGSWYTARSHTGTSPGWTWAATSIPPSATAIRFLFETNGCIYDEGAYVDDVWLYALYTTFDDDAAKGDNAAESEILSQINQTDLFLINYPNPFVNKTTIKYNIPSGEAANISLKIYSAAGQLVRTLNVSKMPGLQSIIWDAKDENGKKVPHGIYIAKLRIGDIITTTRMILVK